MPTPNQHILVVNVFPDDNAGSAALTWAAVELLREAHPLASIGLVPVDGVAAPHEAFRHTLKRYPFVIIHEPLLLLRRRRHAAASLAWQLVLFLVAGRAACRSGTSLAIANASAVVARGGYVFVERGGPRGIASLLATTLPLILAVRLRRPTIALPMSVGPFRSRSSRWFAMLVLRRVTRLLPRDRAAYETLLEMGVKPEKVRLTPDSVLALDLQEPHSSDLPELDGRTAVLTTRHLGKGTTAALQRFSDEEMQSTVERVARKLLDRGLADAFLIVTQSYGADVDERRAVEMLAQQLQDVNVKVGFDLTPAQLVQTYAKAGIVVTQHLHSSIFSVLAGTLPIAMSTDGRKVEGTFREIGLPDGWVLSGGESDAQLDALVDALPTDVEQRRQLLDAARSGRLDHREHLVAELRALVTS